MQDSQTCEGYTNYATFGVIVTLANDRQHAAMLKSLTDGVRRTAHALPNVTDGIWTEDEAARFGLADLLKDYTERLCELGNPSPIQAQMIQAGLSEVNWEELAAAQLGRIAHIHALDR